MAIKKKNAFFAAEEHLYHELEVFLEQWLKSGHHDSNSLSHFIFIRNFILHLMSLYFFSTCGILTLSIAGREWNLDKKTYQSFFKWLVTHFEEKEIFILVTHIFNHLFSLPKLGEQDIAKKNIKIIMAAEKDIVRIVAPKIPITFNQLFFNFSYTKSVEGNIREKLLLRNHTCKPLLMLFNKYEWSCNETFFTESFAKEDLSALVITPRILEIFYEKSHRFNSIYALNATEKKITASNTWSLRKRKGSFYTPRKITWYIVHHTLTSYFLSRLSEFLGHQPVENFLSSYAENMTEPVLFSALQKLEVKNLLFFRNHILKTVKICDNACGSGEFLLVTATYLLQLYRYIDKILAQKAEKNLDRRQEAPDYENNIFKSPYVEYVAKIFAKNLYGVDKDVLAVDITKLRLILWALSYISAKEGDIRPSNYNLTVLKQLDFKIKVGNSLIGLTSTEKVPTNLLKICGMQSTDKTSLVDVKEKLDHFHYELLVSKGVRLPFSEYRALKPFHWIFEFKEAFLSDDLTSITEPGFDIIIGNPPYGKILSKKELKILDLEGMIVKMTDHNGRGTNNAAALFLERSHQLLNKKGYLGYILPKSLLYVSEWDKTRYLLLKEVTLKRVVDCSKAFRDALLEMCIIIFQNQKRQHSNSQQVIVHNFYTWNMRRFSTTPFKISKKYLSTRRFFTEINDEKKDIYDHITKNSITLGTICKIWRGLSLNRYVKKQPTKNAIRILRGDDIGRYVIKKYGYIDSALVEARNFTPGTLLFQEIVAHIENPRPHIKLTGTFNTDLIISVNTITNLELLPHARTFLTEKALLALLNSKLLSWYVYKFIFVNSVRTMHFSGRYAYDVPIIRFPHHSSISQTLTTLTDYLLFLKGLPDDFRQKHLLVEFFDRQLLDTLVYAVYFEDKFERDGLKYKMPELLVNDLHLEPLAEKSRKKTLDALTSLYIAIKKDERLNITIKWIKNHPWIKIIEY